MDLIGYLYDIQKKQGKIKELTSDQQSVLLEFIEPNSVYSFYKKQESFPNPISKKNIRKKVILLHKLGFIESVKIKDPFRYLHKAKYFQLSDLGLFYLLTRRRFRDLTPLLSNYEENPIFEIFLFPFFEKNSIFLNYDLDFHWTISNYIADCLQLILSVELSVKKVHGEFFIGSQFGDEFELLQQQVKHKTIFLVISLMSLINDMNNSGLGKLNFARLKNDKLFAHLLKTTKLNLDTQFKNFYQLN